MIYLLWRLFCIRWKQFWCSHRHGWAGSSPAMRVYKEFLSGNISMDEYRADRSPLNIRRCLRCGKEWEL